LLFIDDNERAVVLKDTIPVRSAEGLMAKKILLAEDSLTMQQVVQMTFAGEEEVSVTAVSTAEEALARAKEMAPDLVLADLSLSGKNGYDICAEVKQQSERTPVVLLHGANAKFDAARARQVNADGDIAKPFDSQALLDLAADVMSAEPKISVQGPIESLSAPIESVEDTEVQADLRLPVSSPAVPAPGGAASPPPPRPVAAKPVAAKPVAAKPVAAKPVAAKPVAPTAEPPRPVAAAAPEPAKPTGRPIPAPAAKPPAPSAPSSEQPIMIEAAPPPAYRPEPLRPFVGKDSVSPTIEPRASRPAATKIGLGGADGALPPPPPGMPLPGAPPPAASAPPRPQASKPFESAPPKPHVPAPAPSAPPKPQAPAPAASVPPHRQAPGAAPAAERAPQAAVPAGRSLELAAKAAGVDPAVYEAITQLTKEVVERIVWEVVPDLAETIIKEQLDRLVEKRAK
jgi:CheY-like chemotaxis protein